MMYYLEMNVSKTQPKKGVWNLFFIGASNHESFLLHSLLAKECLGSTEPL